MGRKVCVRACVRSRHLRTDGETRPGSVMLHQSEFPPPSGASTQGLFRRPLRRRRCACGQEERGRPGASFPRAGLAGSFKGK